MPIKSSSKQYGSKAQPSQPLLLNNKYIMNKVIASGSFGRVYDSYPYAVKEIKLPTTEELHPSSHKRFHETLQNEISILQKVNHENLVRLFEVIYEKDYVYLVMQYCQSDLKKEFYHKCLGEEKSIDVMKQLMKGCEQMVKMKIVHRDIKPANILLKDGVWKLADFGMAKFMEVVSNGLNGGSNEMMLKSHVGTPYYMAPQILEGKPYTKKCDIWSLGIIFYELVFGKLPWDGKDEKALLNNILTQKLRFPKLISEDLKTLLNSMLCIAEHKRANWEQVFMSFELLVSKKRSTRDIKSQKEIKVQQMGLGKKEGTDVDMENRSMTVHRSTMEKIIRIEKDRISVFEFKKKYEHLNIEQKSAVLKILESYFADEYRYILGDFDHEEGAR